MHLTVNSSFRLLSLPVETVENVVLCLSLPTILRLRAVRNFGIELLTDCGSQLSRRMCNLVDTSPTIQYRIELFAASLKDNLRKTSVPIADRLVLLEQYHTRWDKLRGDKWKRVPLPVHIKRVLQGGALGCIAGSGDDKLDVHFIQLPSVSREVRLKQWVVRGLPKCDATLNTNPEADLLVVPEVVNEGQYVAQSFGRSHGDDPRLSTFRIHILRPSDGLPHVLAPGDPVRHYVDYGSQEVLLNLDILASGHRLVAIARLGTKRSPWRSRNTGVTVPTQRTCLSSKLTSIRLWTPGGRGGGRDFPGVRESSD